MRDRPLATVMLALLLVLGLPRCGFRTPGLEVRIVIRPASDTPSGILDVESVELVPCDDVAARIAGTVREIGRAHAHDLAASSPTELTLPTGLDERTLTVRPGSYCGLRARLGSVDRVALELVTGVADWREVTLTFVDASGAPIRLTLAQSGDVADVELTLGGFGEGDPPVRALDHIVERALASARMRAAPAGRP